jgi:hypothetical protein
MPAVTTSDIYECCYYLLKGCELTSIEGRPVNGQIECEVTFTSSKIVDLQLKYFTGEAVVNLFAFRRAYAQINNYIHQARRKLKNELKERESSGDDERGEV